MSILNPVTKENITDNTANICTQHATCQGCRALTAYERSEIVWSLGILKPETDGLLGKCDLGFPQKWLGIGNAIPLKPCPKPELLPVQINALYGLLAGKQKRAKNVWCRVNDVREIVDILHRDAAGLLDVSYIELQLKYLDRFLLEIARAIDLRKPEKFILREWNGFIL